MQSAWFDWESLITTGFNYSRLKNKITGTTFSIVFVLCTNPYKLKQNFLFFLFKCACLPNRYKSLTFLEHRLMDNIYCLNNQDLTRWRSYKENVDRNEKYEMIVNVRWLDRNENFLFCEIKFWCLKRFLLYVFKFRSIQEVY